MLGRISSGQQTRIFEKNWHFDTDNFFGLDLKMRQLATREFCGFQLSPEAVLGWNLCNEILI
jgi:hypothetical protein